MNIQNLLTIGTIALCTSIGGDRSFATIPTMTSAQVQLVRVPKLNNNLIIPGQSVGKINRSTTYADLVKLFGTQRLKAETVYGAEGQMQFPGTLIKLGKNRHLTIVWKDKSKKEISWIIVKDPVLKTTQGLGVGTSLVKLRQIMGEFKITGLYWDYGNAVVDLTPASQAKFTGLSISVDADPQAAKKFPQDLQAVTGDSVTLPASSPRWKRLKMSVAVINVNFSEP